MAPLSRWCFHEHHAFIYPMQRSNCVNTNRTSNKCTYSAGQITAYFAPFQYDQHHDTLLLPRNVVCSLRGPISFPMARALDPRVRTIPQRGRLTRTNTNSPLIPNTRRRASTIPQHRRRASTIPWSHGPGFSDENYRSANEKCSEVHGFGNSKVDRAFRRR